MPANAVSEPVINEIADSKYLAPHQSLNLIYTYDTQIKSKQSKVNSNLSKLSLERFWPSRFQVRIRCLCKKIKPQKASRGSSKNPSSSLDIFGIMSEKVLDWKTKSMFNDRSNGMSNDYCQSVLKQNDIENDASHINGEVNSLEDNQLMDNYKRYLDRTYYVCEGCNSNCHRECLYSELPSMSTAVRKLCDVCFDIELYNEDNGMISHSNEGISNDFKSESKDITVEKKLQTDTAAYNIQEEKATQSDSNNNISKEYGILGNGVSVDLCETEGQSSPHTSVSSASTGIVYSLVKSKIAKKPIFNSSMLKYNGDTLLNNYSICEGKIQDRDVDTDISVNSLITVESWLTKNVNHHAEIPEFEMGTDLSTITDSTISKLQTQSMTSSIPKNIENITYSLVKLSSNVLSSTSSNAVTSNMNNKSVTTTFRIDQSKLNKKQSAYCGSLVNTELSGDSTRYKLNSYQNICGSKSKVELQNDSNIIEASQLTSSNCNDRPNLSTAHSISNKSTKNHNLKNEDSILNIPAILKSMPKLVSFNPQNVLEPKISSMTSTNINFCTKKPKLPNKVNLVPGSSLVNIDNSKLDFNSPKADLTDVLKLSVVKSKPRKRKKPDSMVSFRFV